MGEASARPLEDAPGRTFLFLQGPHGPFFPRLGRELARRGALVERINFNGGDQATWPEGHAYGGTASAWPAYVAAFIRDRGVSDLVLYGDCRPHHARAASAARNAGARVHVFEEGYLRPDWVTLERDGVNGHSRLPSDPDWWRARADGLPPAPAAPPLPSYAAARRWAAFFYYAQHVLQRWRFPFGVSHRARNPVIEGLSYLAKFRRADREQRLSRKALAAVAGRPYFLFPMQLDADYQIRAHSPFAGMADAATSVLRSFAAHAPPDLALLVKEHPLESGLISWRGFFDEAERALGLAGRLAFVEQGDLDALVERAAGVVTVNSTAGAMALATGTPVKPLGRAIYDIPGLTDQQPLDRFWTAPAAPDPQLFDAFRRVLTHRCLLRGAFLSEQGSAALVAGAADRLLAPEDAA